MTPEQTIKHLERWQRAGSEIYLEGFHDEWTLMVDCQKEATGPSIAAVVEIVVSREPSIYGFVPRPH